jgi:3-oxoacyl-ACP reductase-like protein
MSGTVARRHTVNHNLISLTATNQMAEAIESYGCRTFSAKEMAFNVLGLMHPLLFNVAQMEPVWADLNGGMDKLNDLADISNDIRSGLNLTSSIRKAVVADNAADFKVLKGVEAESLHHSVKVLPRANFKPSFPALKPINAEAEFAKLRGVVDLDKVIVITGYAEVGPWGSSRTRWDMEKNGALSIEGILELSVLMGLIKRKLIKKTSTNSI